MILIVPNHLPNIACSELIDIFERNHNPTSKWNCTKFLDINEIDNRSDYVDAKKCSEVICNTSIPTYGIDTYIECFQIVKWETECGQPFHFDGARPSTKITSITYLNEDFSGGSTIIKSMDLSIKPETGKTVYFDGKKYEHGVEKVNSGTRYTLAIWYTNLISESII